MFDVVFLNNNDVFCFSLKKEDNFIDIQVIIKVIMEDEINFMEFFVVDECGSDEGDDFDDEIQVFDEIGSLNFLKESDLFVDMVVLDISISLIKEFEEVKEKFRSFYRFDRFNRYRDKRSFYKERFSRDKRSLNRESFRKDEEKRSDRRRDRSRLKDSR